MKDLICSSAKDIIEQLKEYNRTLYVQEDLDGNVDCQHIWMPEAEPDRKYLRLAAVESVTEKASIAAFEIEPSTSPTNILVLRAIKEDIENDLRNAESELSGFATRSIMRTFVYFDISEFTTYQPVQQLLINKSLMNLVNAQHFKSLCNHSASSYDDLETSICIGDGFIYVFKKVISALYFAAVLGVMLEKKVSRNELPVKYHFRQGIHYGGVYRFYDQDRKGWNYIGDGINGAARIFESIEKSVDDVIYLSEECRSKLVAIKGDEAEIYPTPDLIKAMINRGRISDKHGKKWRRYELLSMNAFAHPYTE